jgi:hypothetical protein
MAQVHRASGLRFECLQQRHFEQPKVVETYPYEALSVSTCKCGTSSDVWNRDTCYACRLTWVHHALAL